MLVVAEAISVAAGHCSSSRLDPLPASSEGLSTGACPYGGDPGAGRQAQLLCLGTKWGGEMAAT